MFNPLAAEPAPAERRPGDEGEGAEAGGLVTADELEMMGLAVDRIDARLLSLGVRLHRLRRALDDAVLDLDEEKTLVAV